MWGEATMAGLLARFIGAAFGLWLASEIVPGVRVQGLRALVLAAAGLGLVNAILRPILVLVTLPLTILTLGLFVLVINAALFALVAALLPGFSVRGPGAAFLGALVVSAAGWLVSGLLNRRGAPRSSGRRL